MARLRTDEDAYRRAVDDAFETFPIRLTVLPLNRCIRFYELLAYHLTIAIRAVWAHDRLPDAEKVELMKWLNEAIHRSLQWVEGLRQGELRDAEDDRVMALRQYTSEHPAIHWLIAQEIFHCLLRVEDNPIYGMLAPPSETAVEDHV